MLIPFEIEDDRKVLIISPASQHALCIVDFVLSADNKPEWQVEWNIFEFEDNSTLDESPRRVLSPAPLKANNRRSFSFEMEPGLFYLVKRNPDSPDDTALGEETILNSSLHPYFH